MQVSFITEPGIIPGLQEIRDRGWGVGWGVGEVRREVGVRRAKEDRREERDLCEGGEEGEIGKEY